MRIFVYSLESGVSESGVIVKRRCAGTLLDSTFEWRSCISLSKSKDNVHSFIYVYESKTTTNIEISRQLIY